MALSSARLRTASASTSMRPGEDRAASRPKITASTSSAPARISAAAGLSQDSPQPVPGGDLAERPAAPNRKASATSPRIARTTVRCAPWRRRSPSASAAMRARRRARIDQRVARPSDVADGGRDQDRQQRLLAHLARDGLGLPAHRTRRGVKRRLGAAGRVGDAPASPGPSSVSRPARAAGRSVPSRRLLPRWCCMP